MEDFDENYDKMAIPNIPNERDIVGCDPINPK
jgi:hypothetical protein